jgi:hypothetical protein
MCRSQFRTPMRGSSGMLTRRRRLGLRSPVAHSNPRPACPTRLDFHVRLITSLHWSTKQSCFAAHPRALRSRPTALLRSQEVPRPRNGELIVRISGRFHTLNNVLRSRSTARFDRVQWRSVMAHRYSALALRSALPGMFSSLTTAQCPMSVFLPSMGCFSGALQRIPSPPHRLNDPRPMAWSA